MDCYLFFFLHAQMYVWYIYVLRATTVTCQLQPIPLIGLTNGVIVVMLRRHIYRFYE